MRLSIINHLCCDQREIYQWFEFDSIKLCAPGVLFQFHFAMGSALVSVISYHRNILAMMLQSKYCGIQMFSNSILNLMVIEGLFQHTARASLPHITLLQDLFFQLFRFLIFVPRFVVNPLYLCFNYSNIWCLVVALLVFL